MSARALADGASSNMTELQKHVSFFDRNKDGIITPLETFQGELHIRKESRNRKVNGVYCRLNQLNRHEGPYIN